MPIWEKDTMKKQNYFNERGQALVLVVLAIVGLFGFAALAIDGSAVFSDRRHSQNASDTSVIAAALARVRPETSSTWETYATTRATDNGYTDGVDEAKVYVYTCDELPQTVDGVEFKCDGLPDGADPAEYVYVHIKSVVKLFLARIVGWSEMTNHTSAVAHASLPVETSWGGGYAMWTTHEGCKSPGDGNPFNLGGNAIGRGSVNRTRLGMSRSSSSSSRKSA